MRAAVGLLTLALLAPCATRAQAGSGAAFGTRDPRTCPDRRAPQRGPITPALAAQYTICAREHGDVRTLYLVDNVKVQIGSSRTFQLRTDSYNDIDPSKPIYPIRGSYVTYSCDVVHLPKQIAVLGDNRGTNCRLYDQPHAKGACYKTTFGDWQCDMQDLDNTLTVLRKDTAPPR